MVWYDLLQDGMVWYCVEWNGLPQDEMVVLSNINSLTQTLHGHTRCWRSLQLARCLAKLPLSKLLPLVEPLAVLTDQQRMEQACR